MASPTIRVMDGVQVAILPLADYRRLVALAGRATIAEAHVLKGKGKHRRPLKRLSTIERDGEVADFLRERFRTRATLGNLHAACLERFGAERTPSASRIGVFRNRAFR